MTNMEPLLTERGGEHSRFEKSLGLLTTKFVSLLQDAEDGILDLKVVSPLLVTSFTIY
jgi:hypothetical protein